MAVIVLAPAPARPGPLGAVGGRRVGKAAPRSAVGRRMTVRRQGGRQLLQGLERREHPALAAPAPPAAVAAQQILVGPGIPGYQELRPEVPVAFAQLEPRAAQRVEDRGVIPAGKVNAHGGRITLITIDFHDKSYRW
jgi:hypothetical protein